MGLLKETDLIDNGVLHHWDGNNAYYSLFEPNHFVKRKRQ